MLRMSIHMLHLEIWLKISVIFVFIHPLLLVDTQKQERCRETGRRRKERSRNCTIFIIFGIVVLIFCGLTPRIAEIHQLYTQYEHLGHCRFSIIFMERQNGRNDTEIR